MTTRKEVYKCEVCGNIVEVNHAAGGELVCCGKPMKLLKENTTDAATEKHVPVIEESGTGIKVAVGSAPHPMEEDHYIEWIEVIDGDRIYKEYLKPGGKPEAEFNVKYSSNLTAREYCNKHGHWKTA